MKKWLPILVLVAGLGSSFSFGQGSSSSSPFDRYIQNTRAGRFEPALERLAAHCGLTLNQARVRFAERPDEVWSPVRRFPTARRDQQTDFFSTAAIWRTENKAVVEIWRMDSEAGDQTRTLYCIHDREILAGEEIHWVSENENEDGSIDPAWGYEVRWTVEKGKSFKATHEGFVDKNGKPAAKPKLGSDAPTTFGLIPEMLRWSDLKLPEFLLK